MYTKVYLFYCEESSQIPLQHNTTTWAKGLYVNNFYAFTGKQQSLVAGRVDLGRAGIFSNVVWLPVGMCSFSHHGETDRDSYYCRTD